jgi:hypothetical protein
MFSINSNEHLTGIFQTKVNRYSHLLDLYEDKINSMSSRRHDQKLLNGSVIPTFSKNKLIDIDMSDYD